MRRTKPEPGSKKVWSDEEKTTLVRLARELEAKLGRPLEARDVATIRIQGRTKHAIKSQAARLELFRPRRSAYRWSEHERQMLKVLAHTRGLGARSIKARGFFSANGSDVRSFRSRSADAIAQMKRRLRLVDENRSRRARYAKRLTTDERRRLRAELRSNPEGKSTEDFAQEYGISPSTVRRYRQRWRIKQTWRDAIELPSARERRRALARLTRERNLLRWRREKEMLRLDLVRKRKTLETRAARKNRPLELRTCARCGETWPATDAFFAPTKKRRSGKVVATYLRRTCRICPRRGKAD